MTNKKNLFFSTKKAIETIATCYTKSEGAHCSTFCLSGAAGQAKTEMLVDYFTNNGYTVFVKNFAEFEDSGDLIGIPYKNGDTTTYAIPYWLKDIIDCKKEKILLILDDFTRSNPTILQATMELINKGSIGGNFLPKNCRIILTTNPSDDGGEEYLVSEIDQAQRTRYIEIKVKLGLNDFLEHLKTCKNIDKRFVQFMSEDNNFSIFDNKNYRAIKSVLVECSKLTDNFEMFSMVFYNLDCIIDNVDEVCLNLWKYIMENSFNNYFDSKELKEIFIAKNQSDLSNNVLSKFEKLKIHTHKVDICNDLHDQIILAVVNGKDKKGKSKACNYNLFGIGYLIEIFPIDIASRTLKELVNTDLVLNFKEQKEEPTYILWNKLFELLK